jgi:hypothetical protein
LLIILHSNMSNNIKVHWNEDVITENHHISNKQELGDVELSKKEICTTV